MNAPSWRLRKFLSRYCSAAMMERLVDPILTDIRIEAEAAASRGQQWASRGVRAAGTVALVKALTFYGWTRFWSIQEWSREDRSALARTLACAAALTAAAIPLLMLPVIIQLPSCRQTDGCTSFRGCCRSRCRSASSSD